MSQKLRRVGAGPLDSIPNLKSLTGARRMAEAHGGAHSECRCGVSKGTEVMEEGEVVSCAVRVHKGPRTRKKKFDITSRVSVTSDEEFYGVPVRGAGPLLTHVASLCKVVFKGDPFSRCFALHHQETVIIS